MSKPEREYTKQEYIQALYDEHRDTESLKLVESLIDEYFHMIEHMKETSLYDVYQYEDRIARNTLDPMRVIVHENGRLKKEVNKLRKQLGMISKYKEE